MSAVTTFIKLLKQPKKMFRPLSARGVFDNMSDAKYLEVLYDCEMGEKLDLVHPRSFNEKIQWLKINDRKQEYPKWVDKESAKVMAEQAIGREHVVPLIASWADVSDIDFDSLPDKCVLKCNHDQGSTMLFDRSNDSDTEKLRAYYAGRLKRSAFRTTREWPYTQIKPKVICEPYLADDIIDYKFFCFNGKPEFVNIGFKPIRSHLTHISFLDFNWNQMPFQRTDFPPVDELPPKPDNLDEMIRIAEVLSKNTYYVRIDLFCIEGRIYFSEFTLYPTSGLIKFSPKSADIELGKKLILPID